MNVDKSTTRVDDVPKEKPKEKDSVQSKPTQSSFDRVLEQNKLLQQMPTNTQFGNQQATEQAVKDTRQDSSRDEADSQSKDNSDTDSDSSTDLKTSDKKSESRSGESRVVSKNRTREQKEGKEGESGSQGKGDGQSDLNSRKLRKLQSTDAQARILTDTSQSKFAKQLNATTKSAELSTEDMQQIVNKVVQAFRIGKNRMGDVELQLDLDATIFKGLKLKLSKRDDGVVVEFLSSGADVEKVFKGAEDEIRKALTAKGIKVADFVVS